MLVHFLLPEFADMEHYLQSSWVVFLSPDHVLQDNGWTFWEKFVQVIRPHMSKCNKKLHLKYNKRLRCKNMDKVSKEKFHSLSKVNPE